MRLRTKEERAAWRKASIDHQLKKEGASLEEYQDLTLVKIEQPANKYWSIEAFKGSSAHPFHNYRYRSAEEFQQALSRLKKASDSRRAYKEEQKAKSGGKRALSSQARAAKAVRAELKENFPGTKFSITSSGFSMGDSVHVEWTDGPTVEQVEKFTSKYQYGHFNGMEDIYENSNSRDDIPQTKFMSERRIYSDSIKEQRKAWEALLISNMGNSYGDDFEKQRGAEQAIYRLLAKTSIPAGAIVTGITTTEKRSGQLEDFYRLEIDTSNCKEVKPKRKAAKPSQPVTVDSGEVKIIAYGKGLAVVGDTKPYKDDLKSIGGRFNPRLSVGCGWVFQMSKLEELKLYFTSMKEHQEKQLSNKLQEVQDLADETIQELDEKIAAETAPIEKAVTKYDSLQELQKAAKGGKVVSLLNMSNLINEEKRQPAEEAKKPFTLFDIVEQQAAHK